MNRPKASSMASPLAIKPMEIKSSDFTRNVTDATANNDHQPTTPRVNSAGSTNTDTSTGFDAAPKDGSKSDNMLLQAGNIRSLVFDAKDVRRDLEPPDENQSPSTIAGKKRKVTGEIPVLEVKKLHAFRKEEMPVYWNISNLKPSKVTRHLRCLLLAMESRPTFDQVRPQYFQLRDHFVYSFGFLQIHSTGPQYQVKLKALYKSVFDKLHRLLAHADLLESVDGEKSQANDENQSDQSDSFKRPRLG